MMTRRISIGIADRARGYTISHRADGLCHPTYPVYFVVVSASVSVRVATSRRIIASLSSIPPSVGAYARRRMRRHPNRPSRRAILLLFSPPYLAGEIDTWRATGAASASSPRLPFWLGLFIVLAVLPGPRVFAIA